MPLGKGKSAGMTAMSREIAILQLEPEFPGTSRFLRNIDELPGIPTGFVWLPRDIDILFLSFSSAYIFS